MLLKGCSSILFLFIWYFLFWFMVAVHAFFRLVLIIFLSVCLAFLFFQFPHRTALCLPRWLKFSSFFWTIFGRFFHMFMHFLHFSFNFNIKIIIVDLWCDRICRRQNIPHFCQYCEGSVFLFILIRWDKNEDRSNKNKKK